MRRAASHVPGLEDHRLHCGAPRVCGAGYSRAERVARVGDGVGGSYRSRRRSTGARCFGAVFCRARGARGRSMVGAKLRVCVVGTGNGWVDCIGGTVGATVGSRYAHSARRGDRRAARRSVGLPASAYPAQPGYSDLRSSGQSFGGASRSGCHRSRPARVRAAACCSVACRVVCLACVAAVGVGGGGCIVLQRPAGSSGAVATGSAGFARPQRHQYRGVGGCFQSSGFASPVHCGVPCRRRHRVVCRSHHQQLRIKESGQTAGVADCCL